LKRKQENFNEIQFSYIQCIIFDTKTVTLFLFQNAFCADRGPGRKKTNLRKDVAWLKLLFLVEKRGKLATRKDESEAN